jgi:hypothetical protein
MKPKYQTEIEAIGFLVQLRYRENINEIDVTQKKPLRNRILFVVFESRCVSLMGKIAPRLMMITSASFPVSANLDMKSEIVVMLIILSLFYDLL